MYRELHARAEQLILNRLRRARHKALLEHRIADCVFDVYDATTDTVYEILTAKFERSSHESDEAILAKLFKYALHSRAIRLVIVSYDHQELDMLHRMAIAHEHIDFRWWSGSLIGYRRHRGASPHTVVKRVLKILKSVAPLSEWYDEKRRQRHPRGQMDKTFEQLTARYGLPPNFLKGLWRDWRLKWVMQMEHVLPLYEELDRSQKGLFANRQSIAP